jgi:hypothetical protein
MSIAQSSQDLVEVVQRAGDWNGSVPQFVLERDAFDVFDQHHQLIVQPQRRVQGRDVGMLEGRLYPDLAHEPVRQIGIRFEVRKQNLHRLHTLGDHVSDPVDLPHASGAEDVNDLVVSDPLAPAVRHPVFSWGPIGSGPRRRPSERRSR